MNSELYALAGMIEPEEPSSEFTDDPHPSGTWRVGANGALHAAGADDDAERFGTSDSDAPTVRPGALRRR